MVKTQNFRHYYRLLCPATPTRLSPQCNVQRSAQADLTAMIEGARIPEKDSYGPKVYLLADGNILKLFRRKRLFSSALFRPYSKRFIDNVAQLQQRGILP